jgi:hypothetical protein
VHSLHTHTHRAGRGKLEDTTTCTTIEKVIDSKIVAWSSSSRCWIRAADPLHCDKPDRCGVGPGISFARGLKSKHKIGLVPCAVGGTDIETWLYEMKDKVTGLNPWKDCLLKTKSALKSGKLCAILWHQGESDCTETKSKDYAKHLVAVVKKFRKEFGDVPFLCGQLGHFDENPWNEHHKLIDESHRALPKLLPNCAFVSSKGLTSFDSLHFDTHSAKILGERYANAYMKMI